MRHLASIAVCVLIALSAGVFELRRSAPVRADVTSSSVRITMVTLQPADPTEQIVATASLVSNSTAELHARLATPQPASVGDHSVRREQSVAEPITRSYAEAEQFFDTEPVARVTEGASFEFERRLFAHIQGFRRYPNAARQEQLHGVVQLLFAMGRDGTLHDVRIRTSSGSAILDLEAMDTIRRAEPLPPIPAELPDRLQIALPFEFSPS